MDTTWLHVKILWLHEGVTETDRVHVYHSKRLRQLQSCGLCLSYGFLTSKLQNSTLYYKMQSKFVDCTFWHEVSSEFKHKKTETGNYAKMTFHKRNIFLCNCGWFHELHLPQFEERVVNEQCSSVLCRKYTLNTSNTSNYRSTISLHTYKWLTPKCYKTTWRKILWRSCAKVCTIWFSQAVCDMEIFLLQLTH
jgi:hypothetical protein